MSAELGSRHSISPVKLAPDDCQAAALAGSHSVPAVNQQTVSIRTIGRFMGMLGDQSITADRLAAGYLRKMTAMVNSLSKKR